ncbi:MAG TPA: hypothetical protein VHY08_11620 [Bacillota bacterium]|nr:hypothetical protein [Bacillota bacterium]
MNVFMIINQITYEIAAYALDWPVDRQFKPEMGSQKVNLPAPLEGYLMTDPNFYDKVRDASEFICDMKPVFDQKGDLVDVYVKYPDLGEDR